jgi:hypothetical protein
MFHPAPHCLLSVHNCCWYGLVSPPALINRLQQHTHRLRVNASTAATWLSATSSRARSVLLSEDEAAAAACASSSSLRKRIASRLQRSTGPMQQLEESSYMWVQSPGQMV